MTRSTYWLMRYACLNGDNHCNVHPSPFSWYSYTVAVAPFSSRLLRPTPLTQVRILPCTCSDILPAVTQSLLEIKAPDSINLRILHACILCRQEVKLTNIYRMQQERYTMNSVLTQITAKLGQTKARPCCGFTVET